MRMLAFIEESSGDVGFYRGEKGGCWLGFCKAWEPWIQRGLVGTHIRVVTRPPASPYISHTCKKQLTVLGRTGVWYFDRLQGSTWKIPSWSTNRPLQATIHLLGSLLVTVVKYNYTRTFHKHK